jgi:hypothetical protein
MKRENVFTIFFALLATTICFLSAPASGWTGERLWVLMEERVVWILDTTDIAENPGQAEITLIEELAGKGFDVVDSAAVRKGITQAQGLRVLEGDEQAAAAIGLQYGADYSVIGKAFAKLGTAGIYGTNLKTVHATVSARLIRNSDARIVASASAKANAAHLDEVQGGAIAIEQAAREIADKLDAKFRKLAVVSGSEVVLNISGLKSFRQLDTILQVLENSVPGVEKIAIGNFTSGTAQLTMAYRGEIRELATFLVREGFPGFRLEPTHVTSNRIDLKSVSE